LRFEFNGEPESRGGMLPFNNPHSANFKYHTVDVKSFNPYNQRLPGHFG
jgi:hypothetical protein